MTRPPLTAPRIPRGLRPGPAPVHHLVPQPLAGPIRRPPRRHRVLRERAGSDRPRPGHRHPPAVHHRRILQIRGRGRAPGPIAGRPRTPPAGRLRVQCRRPGPQRARRTARRRRARLGVRACAEWAIDLAVGERTEGPIFLARDARRLDRHGAGRIVRRIARRTGITKLVTPHTLRHAFITAALDAGVPLQDVQEAASHADPRTTMRYDRARGSLDRHATYIVAAYLTGAAR
jgi:hypothetical protein